MRDEQGAETKLKIEYLAQKYEQDAEGYAGYYVSVYHGDIVYLKKYIPGTFFHVEKPHRCKCPRYCGYNCGQHRNKKGCIKC